MRPFIAPTLMVLSGRQINANPWIKMTRFTFPFGRSPSPKMGNLCDLVQHLSQRALSFDVHSVEKLASVSALALGPVDSASSHADLERFFPARADDM